jgi:hypothetical protein
MGTKATGEARDMVAEIEVMVDIYWDRFETVYGAEDNA